MREVGIGLLGLGTVGSGVVEIIQRRKDEWQRRYGFKPVIQKILVKDLQKKRSLEVEPSLLTVDLNEVISDPKIEVVIEVIGGEDSALKAARHTLEQGKHLITANKLMLAKHGPELFKRANTHNVELAFEASVGGGIPIIRPLQESFCSNDLQALIGILNATTNYILTGMTSNCESYFDVLAKAQALGYAETDPTADVLGHDACYKLSVLTGVAFGQQLKVAEIPTEGITRIDLYDLKLARELGYVIKLLAKVEKVHGCLWGHVHPTFLPLDHPLAQINGVNNALLVKGDAVGEVILSGPGAGMMATGSAVCSDLVRVARIILGSKCIKRENHFPEFVKNLANKAKACFFLTLKNVEKPDLDEIIAKMSQSRIPVQKLFSQNTADLYHIGILTEFCTEQEIKQFIQNLHDRQNYRQIVYYYVEGSESK